MDSSKNVVAEPEIQINVTPKELTYTKSIYEKLVEELKAELSTTKTKGKAYQELYGMYYCAIIGLIRSGALCSRISGKDGFPEIKVFVGSKYYKCREDVIYSIIGQEEAKDIITPYEDSADSYIKKITIKEDDITEPVEVSNPVTDSSATKVLKKEIDSLKKEKKAIEEAAQAKYNDLNARYQKALDANKEIPVVASQEDAEVVAKLQAHVDELRNELEEWRKRYKQAEENVEEVTRKANMLQSKLDEKEEEAKKYIYDPNYDHYYNDELPVILENLEFSHTGALIRAVMMAGCFAGLTFCLLMFI
jgi:DNA repair exonuclease SbcCD ATPase subunit